MMLGNRVNQLPGVGPSYAKKLTKLEIITANDLLYHFPFRYIDYSLTTEIVSLQAGETVTLRGKIVEIKNAYLRGRRLTIQKAVLKDATGTINLTWFNQPYLIRSLLGKTVSVSGKVNLFGGKLNLESPDFELFRQEKTIHTGRLVPVYKETKGVSSKWLRAKIAWLLKQDLEIFDPLPKEYLSNYHHLYSLNSALTKIHFPANMEEVEKAREKLAFDELFYLQLVGMLRKKEWQKEKIGYQIKIEKYQKKIRSFINKLPFSLTEAQNRTVLEIIADFKKPFPMNRLLQGDVGSGKTVVAAIAIYASYLSGYNSVFMAPTEILANQHFQTLTKILGKEKIKVALLTGSTLKIPQNHQVIIGTHALLYHQELFKKVALVVIDEQHRFGVEQRANLTKQKTHPHLLTMTATPIPRTVALTLYGELELSIIDELPKGRKIIKTYLVPKTKYQDAFAWINKKIKEGKKTGKTEQAYIIYPLIEESEVLIEVKAATQEFKRLSREVFPDLRLGLLHGKLKSAEKNRIMTDFRLGKIDVLVSTSVVEVGMDVPNATVMVVEQAERFGLAQLHQLRGRVGRSNKESFCLLFSDFYSSRLKAMEKHHLGIKLAEIDLKLRGAGEIYGVKQHGRLELKIADFSDLPLIELTRQTASRLIADDPKLLKHPLLKKRIQPELRKNVKPD